MSYIGQTAEITSIKKIDSLSSTFDGSSKVFNIASGGTAITPGSAAQCIIAINNILLEPFTDYTVSGNTLTLTGTAPTNGQKFVGIVLGKNLNMGSPATDASSVVFTPAGSISASNVQSAIVEMDGDITALLSAIAAKADNASPTITGTLNLIGGITNVVSVDGVSAKIGFRHVPQVSQNGAYTLTTSDSGKHVYSVNSGAQTITLPTNAVQQFEIGASISIVNNGTNPITFTTTGTTVYKAGTSTAWASGGTLAVRGLATFIKVDTNTWFVSGAGLS